MDRPPHGPRSLGPVLCLLLLPFAVVALTLLFSGMAARQLARLLWRLACRAYRSVRTLVASHTATREPVALAEPPRQPDLPQMVPKPRSPREFHVAGGQPPRSPPPP
jgi:hypothetical protein